LKRFIAASIYGYLIFYLGTITQPNCSYEHKVSNNPENLEEFWCLFSNFIYLYNDYAGAVFTLILIFLGVYWDRREHNKRKRNVYEIIDYYMDDKLSQDIINHRITVFKRTGFFKAFLYYIKSTISKFRYFIKSGNLTNRLIKMPLPFNSYLIIYCRFGQPNQDIKSTIFKIHKELDESTSFTEFIFHSRIPKHIDLPEISEEEFKEIKKSSNITDINNIELQKKVVKYISSSRVKSFKQLKSFSRLSPFIGGVPLFTKQKSQSKPTHLIIFDSNSQSFTSVKKTFPRLGRYLEIILKNK